jgi:hypothetical protein
MSAGTSGDSKLDFSSLPEEFTFHEWWDRQQDPEWVEVAEGKRGTGTSCWGTSWLIAATDDAVEEAFRRAEFDVDFQRGKPSFGSLGESKEVLYLRNGMFPGEPEPFLFWREFHDLYPMEVAVLQEFVLYHDLYFENDSNAYINPVSQTKIVECHAEPVSVRIRRDAVRDFLAARKQILVRGFDNRKTLARDDKQQFVLPVRTPEQRFDLWVRPEHARDGDTNLYVRMLGKYLVRPYPQPKHKSYPRRPHGEGEKVERTPFIIGNDESGNPRVAETHRDADFLTPVFFRKDVLQKYYNHPRLYRVEPTLIRHLDFWILDYGVNGAGFVHAWLGDLWQSLPFEEQVYWRSFNVVPSGGLEASFFINQIEGGFADTEREDHRLIKARDALDHAWNARFGFPLFRSIPTHEAYIASALHIPTSAERREFNEQIGYLAKVMVEALNKAEIEEAVTRQESLFDEQGHKKPSIATLEVFVGEHLPNPDAAVFCSQLRLIQTLRSKLPAHLTSESEMVSVLEKNGSGDWPYPSERTAGRHS